MASREGDLFVLRGRREALSGEKRLGEGEALGGCRSTRAVHVQLDGPLERAAWRAARFGQREEAERGGEAASATTQWLEGQRYCIGVLLNSTHEAMQVAGQTSASE